MFERMTVDDFRKEFPNGIPSKKTSNKKNGRQRPPAEKFLKVDCTKELDRNGRPNKYWNNRVLLDNFVFDSEKESDRYGELKQMERVGLIRDLKLQVAFTLLGAVQFEDALFKKREAKYIADFTYYCNQREKLIIEDVKSKKTAKLPVYRLKKHMMKALLGLDITEV